ncbi:MAG: processing protein, partial [Candidatus Peribacteria bacterium]|nr:processing protein [Candidatus Peribacteria bacterium]
MMNAAFLTWSFLHVLTKDRLEAMLGVYGDLETALTRMGPELLQALGCRPDTVEKTLVRLEEFDANRYATELARRGIQIVDMFDPLYPSRLLEIGDPPVFLSYKGDLSILSQPTIGLVGTRAMTNYGKRVTEFFTPAFVQACMVTVSGL